MATPADIPADADAPVESPADPPSPPEAVTLLLVRHGMTDATGPRLAGRAPNVHLNDNGRGQAADLASRLEGIVPAALVSSPLERCQETAEAISERLGTPVTTDERFVECDYGSWTGRSLTDLAAEPLWRVVQDHPSAARFPGGEALAATSARAVEAVRDWNGRLLQQASAGDPPPLYVVCSHGDVIKAIIADALGLHLDLFQRLRVDPCSVTSITYTRTRPFLNKLNDTGEPLSGALPTAAEAKGDAAVGGGAGQGDRTERAPGTSHLP
ncbi:MAG: MSMEG_4193 family putative phosphomutase [Nocardiopsis sp. BM-2018]|uniref:Putative phosphoglycerate mutase n=1 Tax=Nocardiopsis metallicus TaxID=179819 RepID=A0A840W247_9ACTN|nr:MSMEG_4193 family putative phosphomutase [Nocardiopsis metallicus]MBB5490899.1 putative phosphoglycerate mutase [Nocardiopsis metallicus]QRN79916.1 MAG: MSMEG_4193 family putative phosphomutase [Nocardiopsis sp. BM-2018]